MPSGKVQCTEYTAFKFGCDLAGKLCQLFGIICVRTPGGKLPEDGVFGNSGNRSHAYKSATFKRILQLGQGVIPLPIAVNAVKNSLRPIGCNLFETLNGDLRYSSGK